MLKNEFINEIREMLGDELPAFLHSLEEKPALALRVNPLRAGAFEAAAQFLGDKVPWAKDGYYLIDGQRPGASIEHACGAFYMQEASAMVSAAILDAQPGEKILDLCAAPGGKTSQVAAAMAGRGVLVSNEPIPGRAKILAENLERLGIVNAVGVNAYPEQLSARWPDFFDAVLVDAPCSGEGMFRREPASRDEWNPGSPAGCARRQKDILDEAAKMLRPGGRLVYSTCTFNRMENEGSIEGFLERHPEFEIEEFELDGVGKSVNGMIRVWPHRVRGDGHFAAKLRKKMDAEPQRVEKKEKKRAGKPRMTAVRTVADESPEQLLERLEREVCRIPEVLRGGRLIRQADYVHVLPEGAPELDGVKTVKPGLCLMRVGRSHVQPMPALAMASNAGEEAHLGTALRACEVGEDMARKILNGEKPKLTGGEKGWTLAQYHGLPLAFLKQTSD